MADWCNNTVTFTGNEENLKSVTKFMQDMYERHVATKLGVLPVMQDQALYGYYFDMQEPQSDDDWVMIQYSTKWSINALDLAWFAEKLSVSFEAEYEVNSNYGKYRMTFNPENETQILEHKALSEEQIALCTNYVLYEKGKILEKKCKGELSEEEREKIEELEYEEETDYDKIEETLDDDDLCGWSNVN